MPHYVAVWARYVVAPWWLRWLVSASWLALWLVPAVVLFLPEFLSNIGWPSGLLSLAAFSLFVSALTTFMQDPVQRSYAAALTGLTAKQRIRAVKALRRGEVPDDPQVLAAALRVGTLTMAYRRRAPSWARTSKWWLPVLWIAIGVLEFLVNDTRRGVFWIVLTSVMAAQSVWRSYQGRRLPALLERLRSAASATPAENEDNLELPPRRRWVVLPIFLIFGIAGGAMAFASNRTRPECRIADSAVNFIADHRDMLDARLITPGEPGLDKYQNWSDRLQNSSRQVSAPDVAPHLRRIAELSMQAESLVVRARPGPQVNLSSDEIQSLETSYQTTVNQLVDEDNAVLAVCHPRR